MNEVNNIPNIEMTEEYRITMFVGLMRQVMDELTAERMASRLRECGFFTAPASTKYHGSYEGGLFAHSYAVTRNLLRLTKALGLEWRRKVSPYYVGMFHDLCKVGLYAKNESGGYDFNRDAMLPGHGERSVILAYQLVNLTNEEALCIRWHMGAFDDKELWNSYGRAIEQFPNVLWTHTADMMASRIDGI